MVHLEFTAPSVFNASSLQELQLCLLATTVVYQAYCFAYLAQACDIIGAFLFAQTAPHHCLLCCLQARGDILTPMFAPFQGQCIPACLHCLLGLTTQHLPAAVVGIR